MIRGLYHPSPVDYSFYKSIGFTHMEVSVNAYPGNSEKLQETLDRVHFAGLFGIVDFGMFNDQNKAIEFLKNCHLHDEDILMICDEPNIKNIPPGSIVMANGLLNKICPRNKTMITLSWIKDFHGYDDVCNFIGLDYYKSFYDLWSLAVFTIKVKLFESKNHASQIVAVPAIRFSPGHIKRQSWYWRNILGTRNFIWYSATPDQENPPWADFDLSRLHEETKALQKINKHKYLESNIFKEIITTALRAGKLILCVIKELLLFYYDKIINKLKGRRNNAI